MPKKKPKLSKKALLIRILLPLIFVIAWIGAAGIGGPYFGRIEEVSSNDLADFLPDSAESTQVNKQLDKYITSSAVPTILVFESDEQISDQHKDKLDQVAIELRSIEAVNGEISPSIISEDKKAALIVVPLSLNQEIGESFDEINRVVKDVNTGIDYKIGGPASYSRDIQAAFGGIDVTLLLVALIVVFVILIVIYRSPLLPILVLLTAMAALSTAILVVWHLANIELFTLNGQVQGILFILVIGATTDYSLLYIARLREELHEHTSVLRATWAALKGSWEPILAAGSTVIVGLLCLLLSELDSNQLLGPVGAIGIVFAMLAALTLLPALLVLTGRVALWPRRPEYDTSKKETYFQRHPLWARVGRLVQKRPRRLWVGISAALLIACLGIFQLKADGVPQGELVLGYSEAREAQVMIDRHFAGGSGSPAYVVTSADTYQDVVTAFDVDNGVSSVSVIAVNSPSGTVPVGKAEDEVKSEIASAITTQRQETLDSIRQSIATQLAGSPDFVIEQAYEQAAAEVPSVDELVETAYPFKDASEKIVDDNVLLEVTLTDPADSEAAGETITRMRASAHAIDSTAAIGGSTAIQYDTKAASNRDLWLIIPIVLAAITVILGLLLRSIIAPLVLLATTVVSFVATLGIAAFVFNYLLGFPGADPSVVLFGFVFLVALGIDYNIFLMTRVREEVFKISVSAGVIKALVVTGGVITSAGIVLAATFAALGVIPILFLAQIAFIVAFGVMLDTIIVRSLLVPALALELGKKLWWPSKPKK
jgi:RND superfamily putative drug exporter